MSLVVPAEKPDAVHTETDRVERILVVDDDVRLRTLLQRFLEDKGFVVKTAHDATQMDRLLQRELFSLIVLDFMLPVEDGLSICRRLRQSNIDIPIIMLTARGSDSDRIAGLEAGADDYLPKPFNQMNCWHVSVRFCVVKSVKFQVLLASKWKWYPLAHGHWICRHVP